VLGLMIVLLLTGVTLGVVLWIGTVYLQGYWYTEPNPNAYWQAPAAAAALTLFLLFWCVLDVNATHDQGAGFEPYDTLFQFSAVEDLADKPVDRIWVVRAPSKELILYKAQRKVNGYEYRDAANKPLGLAGVEAIFLEDTTGKIGEKGEKIRFDLNKDADSGSSRFVSAQGWAMGENNLGQPSIFRMGRFLANLFLNFFHLALWFACLWLLLRFQWAHALGLALVLWLILTLTLLPTLMDRSGKIARPPPAPPTPQASAEA
jgi:hypothetical protein